MVYCAEYCIDMPDDFPVEAFTRFMAVARSILLPQGTDKTWAEFANASNLVGWRYRASAEDWLYYRTSWERLGADVDHEELYRRERALFVMFTAGVSSIESTAYALAALASHPKAISLPFTPKQQRYCSPTNLATWLAPTAKVAPLKDALSKLCDSGEWKTWIDLRNRMSHRSCLPRIISVAIGSEPPPAKPLHFDATSSTSLIDSDLDAFDALHLWLAATLGELLTEATNCFRLSEVG